MEYEVEGARPRGREIGERLWKKDCQARGLNREDAMDEANKGRLMTMIDVSG